MEDNGHRRSRSQGKAVCASCKQERNRRDLVRCDWCGAMFCKDVCSGYNKKNDTVSCADCVGFGDAGHMYVSAMLVAKDIFDEIECGAGYGADEEEKTA